ncbi:MAG: AAA domain-containing protein, partial [Thermodesulfobacteriota bacterium]
GRCTTCSFFEYCYREALQTEDIQFLHGLTEGTLRKFRSLKIKTIELAYEWLTKEGERTDQDSIFSPDQKDRLKRALEALRLNKIVLYGQKTDIFPGDISTAIFFHIVEDQVTGLPRGLGLRVVGPGGGILDTQTWIIHTEKDLEAVWKEFSGKFLGIWQAGIQRGSVPHVFHFGKNSLLTLRGWGEEETLLFLLKSKNIYITDLHQVISKCFDFPAPGQLTLFAVSRLLGLTPELEEPISLFHLDNHPITDPERWVQDEKQQKKVEQLLQTVLTLQTKLWSWISNHLKGGLDDRREFPSQGAISLKTLYINFIEEEKRLREEDILHLQSYPLKERVDRFRAIGPLVFLSATLDEEGCFLYDFQIESVTRASKFREGDFLKLTPIGISNLQDGQGVILVNYNWNIGQVRIRSRQGRLALSKQVNYSLEEDITDWNSHKLIRIVQTVFSEDRSHPLFRFIPLDVDSTGSESEKGFCSGELKRDSEELRWIQKWLNTNKATSGLNQLQQQALMLPFRYRLSLIEGPPGTGKTHLLGWILIALIQSAKEAKIPLRIAVSALTHQAIDNVLKKVASLVNENRLTDFPGQCLKWGTFDRDKQPQGDQVKPLGCREELARYPYVILGATGFGLYQLFEGDKGVFPEFFDWIIFDEASQILVPQALLSLIYGKSNFLFLGDVKQLPPIILGSYPSRYSFPSHSILSLLLDRYGPEVRIRLNETYRMNKELCAFPGMMWYDSDLRSAHDNENSRLVLSGTGCDDLLDNVLSPDKPLALLLVNHQNCHQKSDKEAAVAAKIAFRLMAEKGLRADQMAIISPHRAQNNAIADHLGKLFGDVPFESPIIDTVERMQGAERDVIIFSLTTSDLDLIEGEFLNNPNRFNVAVTRARQKLIVIGSSIFFSNVARREDALKMNYHIKAFYEFCRERGCVYSLSES